MPKTVYFRYPDGTLGRKIGSKYWVMEDEGQRSARWVPGLSPREYQKALERLQRLRQRDPGGNITL